MTNDVNNLLRLIQDARELSRRLWKENFQNQLALLNEQPEALAEYRPLNLEERVKEARKLRDLFSTVQDKLDEVCDTVSNNY